MKYLSMKWMLRSMTLGLLVWMSGGLLGVPAWAAPAVGAPAPEFRLQDQNGDWVSLKDYRGKWVVLYFYPKDNTPGCTTQACDFRDDIFAFRRAEAVILDSECRLFTTPGTRERLVEPPRELGHRADA